MPLEVFNNHTSVHFIPWCCATISEIFKCNLRRKKSRDVADQVQGNATKYEPFAKLFKIFYAFLLFL